MTGEESMQNEIWKECGDKSTKKTVADIVACLARPFISNEHKQLLPFLGLVAHSLRSFTGPHFPV